MSTTYQKSLEGLHIDRNLHINPSIMSLYMHTHNMYELLYILSGDVTHVVEDRKYKLKKHDLVIVKPNDYHFIQIDSSADYERYDILFDPETLGVENIKLLPANLDVINCRYKPIVTDLFKKIDFYNSCFEKSELREIVTLLLKELIYNLSITGEMQNSDSYESAHPLIGKALAEINANLFTIKSISEIAKKLFVTESYLYRVFRRELKTTPLKYITEKRLNVAQSLIMQGNSPTHIYQECGFADYTSFYRSYVKLFNRPPSERHGKVNEG